MRKAKRVSLLYLRRPMKKFGSKIPNDCTLHDTCSYTAERKKPIGTQMFTNLRLDLNAILERDPAASSKWAVVFYIQAFK